MVLDNQEQQEELKLAEKATMQGHLWGLGPQEQQKQKKKVTGIYLKAVNAADGQGQSEQQ